MRRHLSTILALIAILPGCNHTSSERADQRRVQQQQEQYSISQPIPAFEHSLERDWLIQLYELRNQKVTTHTVWRGDTSVIEGDCPSLGFGMPYDTSLTNPWQALYYSAGGYGPAVGQAEPNGIFASTNTAATWVMCLGAGGSIEPVYVEAKVTSYAYPVKVDYENNRVTKSGDATVTLSEG